MHSLSPLVYVVRTRFHFRPHTPGTDTSLLDIRPLTGMKPDFYQLIGLQTVNQRFHLGAFSFRACQDAFRIQRHYPGVLSLGTGLTNAGGVEGRVAQHHDLGPLYKR